MQTLPAGTKIRILRFLHAMQQGELAPHLGISRQWLSIIETDRADAPEDVIKRAEQVFGLRFDDPRIETAFWLLATVTDNRQQVASALATLEQPNGR